MKKCSLVCLGISLLILMQACSSNGLMDSVTKKPQQNWVFNWSNLPADQSPLFYTWSEPYLQQAIEEKLLPLEIKDNVARYVTRAEFISWLVKTIPGKASRKAFSYQDISKKNPYYSAVVKAYSAGIITDSEKFEPDQPLIRSEASLWLVRALGKEAATLAGTFSEPYIPAQDGFDEVPNEAIGSMTVCYLPTYQLLYYRWMKNAEYRYAAPNQPMMVFEAAYSLVMLRHRPVKGGSVIIGQKEEPVTLFSGLDKTVEMNKPLTFLEMPLLQGRDENWCFFPVLIKQIPTFENGLWKIEEHNGVKKMVVRYELHRGLKWSDGSDLTARDVVFGTYLYLHPAFPGTHAQEEKWIEKIEAPDDYTIIVTWKQFFLFANHRFMNILPVSFFQKELQQTLKPYSLADPHYWDPSKDIPVTQEDETFLSAQYLADKMFIEAVVQSSFNTKPVYAGPYRLKQWQKGVEIEFEPNPYFIYGPPLIERVVWKTIKDSVEFNNGSEVLFAAVLAGKVDVTLKDLTMEQALSLQDKPISHRPYFAPSMRWEHLVLNTDDPILSNRKIRQALLYGMDRKAILLEIYGNAISPADTWYPPLHPVSRNADWVEYSYNPEKARDLLTEAGWVEDQEGRLMKEGKQLTITFMTTAGNPLRERVQKAITAYWRELGIQVNLKQEEGSVLFDRILPHRLFSGPTVVMFSTEQHPDYNGRTTLHSLSIPSQENNRSGMNYTAFQSPQVDAWLTASEQATNKTEYFDNLLLIQMTMMEELPCIPLFFHPIISSADQDLQNFTPSGTSSLTTWNVAYWYWKSLKNHRS